MIKQTRILLQALVPIGTFWTTLALFAQPQLLPQIPLSPMSPPQSAQNQLQQSPQEADTMSLLLTRTPPDSLVQALRQVCGHRFVAQAQYQFLFSSNRNNVPQQSLLRIDPQVNRVVLSGDRQLSAQVYHLIAAIDQPPPPGKGRQLVPFQHTPPDVLVRAFDSYRVQRPIAPRKPQEPPDGVQQVQFEEGLGGIDPGMFMPGTGTPGFFQSSDPTQIGIVDDFTWRIVPGLDVIIIEAEGGRLAQFIEMIRQLEELSKTNRPKVEVVYLKHQNNVSIGALLSQNGGDLYNTVFLMVQGQVRIIPMTSPNGMLLIGWGDAMDVAKEFIASLDLPPSVENSRLHFFKLKYISATNARATVQGTLPAPPMQGGGFVARLQLFIDQRTNLLIVQGAPNEIAEVEQILKEIDVPDAGPSLEVKPILVKHSLVTDMQQTLTQAITSGTTDGKSPALELRLQSEEGQRIVRSGILSDVLITTDVRKNILFVRAPEACMEFLEELINLIDTANPEAAIKIFQIEHGDANSLIVMLERLIPSNIAGQAGPQLPGTDQGEGVIPLRFAIDTRTNSIVAAGSAGDLIVIEALLKSLDQEDMLSRESKVYFLKNQKAGPVADTISAYMENLLRIQAAAPGVTSDFQQIATAVIVVADVESNSLIINATPKYFEEVMELIQEIDKSPPQVVIQVLIAEVTLSDNKEWAAELGLQDPLMFLRGSGLGFNSSGSTLPVLPAVNPGTIGTQGLSNFGGARGAGLSIAASSDYLNIALHALQSKKRLEVLSSPTITTMNNQQAVISVGETVPRAMGGTMNQNGVTDYRVVDTPVNMMLTIIPTISPEGTLVMAMSLIKDKVGKTITIGSGVSRQEIQSIDTASMVTSVSAANNQTVVLGGLITKDQDDGVQKVPLLGDIPLLGKLFRQESGKTNRKELLVILTPRIVTTHDDLDHIRQVELARMSWCLKNVVETHGDIGAYSVVSSQPYTGNAPILTPGPVKMESLQPMLAPTLPTPILPQKN